MWICRSRAKPTRWRIASKWYVDCPPEEKLFTKCCACRVRADHCKVRIWREPRMSYYEDRHEIVCRKGFGCNANPRKRRGMELRELCHYGR